jgi:hypothetical protein
MRGKCFCGKVEFELSGAIPNMYQCHCSLCRKVSGSSANAALIINVAQFRWISGQNEISAFQSETGYKSEFCRHCGSPLPNLTRDDSAYWVPVGLLEDTWDISVAAHVFVTSRAHWDVIPDAAEHFDQMPAAEVLEQLFQAGKK